MKKYVLILAFLFLLAACQCRQAHTPGYIVQVSLGG